MDTEIKELALDTALSEARLLLDEMRERQRSTMLLMDHYVEQTRALHGEARKIVAEVAEDRRRLQGILQRMEAILGLTERLYDMVTNNNQMRLGGNGEEGRQVRDRQSNLRSQ